MTAAAGPDRTGVVARLDATAWLQETDPRLFRRLKIDDPQGCWEWTGYRLPRMGHGVIGRGNTRSLVHRYVWSLVHGEIPEGAFICHRCDNPPCVNPDHLFLGDALSNARDMFAKGRNRNGKETQTHCKRGHPLSGENLAVYRGYKGHPRRTCRKCARDTERARRNTVRVSCPHCGGTYRMDTLRPHIRRRHEATVAAALGEA